MCPSEIVMMREIIPDVEMIADYHCETGENPLWHLIEQRLYWTDIPTGRIFRFDPATRVHEQIYSGRPVGGFTFQQEGGLLLFRDRGNIAHLKQGQLITLIEEIPAEAESRFNDVIADPLGRVFCGTMSTSHSHGRLYRLERDGALSVVAEGIGCSNGMGFTLDGRGFYYTDSFAGTISFFDYSMETGDLSNKQVFATLPESLGLPDGLTVDADGGVWSAIWDGYALLRFEPSGEASLRIRLPVRKVSSVTFGGEDLRDLYITTAGGHTKQEDGNLAGALLRVRSDIAGRPECFSGIQIESH